MRALCHELESRDQSDDVVILAKRSNARRLLQLDDLAQEITALEGIEASGKYDPDAVERAARIVATEHASIVSDIQLELEALKAYFENEESSSEETTE